REQLVEDGAQRVDVGERADLLRLAAGLLRGHVRGRAEDGAGPRLAGVLAERLGEAEVGDLGDKIHRGGRGGRGGRRQRGTGPSLLPFLPSFSSLLCAL